MIFPKLVAAALVISCATVCTAYAQGGATVSGQVADETGGVLPGVSVSLQPAGTQTLLETVTDGEGRYRFDNVPAGPAEISFRLINFSAVRRDITVAQGPTTANAVMLVSASADITITAPRTFRNLAEVENPAENLVGVASAGSEGAITAAQLAVRPVNRATEILETVPGLVISQHSGEGKANQYYLRGFNLDHGFDFAQTIAGIPVNMPTHAHAQGYADANYPDSRARQRRAVPQGPLLRGERGLLVGRLGQHQLLQRPRPADGDAAHRVVQLSALAGARPRRSWVRGTCWRRSSTRGTTGRGSAPTARTSTTACCATARATRATGFSLTFMGFSNHWHSTDQIPKRAVDAGLISRFGFIEETDGGETFRYSGAFDWQHSSTNDSTRATAYVQRYGVQLFHNFTYFMNDPENGDQFEQFERRWTSGGKVTHRHMQRIFGKPTESAFGVDLRNDSVGGPLGLYHTKETVRLSTSRADEADQTSVGIFGETEIEWSRVVRTTFGLRGNVYRWNVESDNPLNSGDEASANLSTPRCRRRSGRGRARSCTPTSARATTRTRRWASCSRVDPVHRRASGRVARRSHRRGAPRSASEQWPSRDCRPRQRSGISASTPSWSTWAIPAAPRRARASRRTGVEITNYIYPNRWTAIDLDMSFSKARYIDVPEGEDFIPGALNRVISGGISVNPPAGVGRGPFGSFRVRHFGPRSLIEDDSVRSDATTILNGETGYKFSERLRLVLEGFNLADAEVSDIDYYFASRLKDEPAPVDDIHFHAAIPRSFRLALQVSF